MTFTKGAPKTRMCDVPSHVQSTPGSGRDTLFQSPEGTSLLQTNTPGPSKHEAAWSRPQTMVIPPAPEQGQLPYRNQLSWDPISSSLFFPCSSHLEERAPPLLGALSPVRVCSLELLHGNQLRPDWGPQTLPGGLTREPPPNVQGCRPPSLRLLSSSVFTSSY